MENGDEFVTLNPDELARLRELSARFARASAVAPDQKADPAAYLPPQGDPLRPVAVRSLVAVDLETRWRRGERAKLESYVARFPELGGASGVTAALVYEEYRIRQLHGDQPKLEDYEARFPAQFGEFRRMAQERATRGGNVPFVPTLTPAPTPILPSGLVTPRPAGELGGGYRLIKRLGAGSYGEVWRAEAPGGVSVAVKIISRPLDHEEAQRELQSLALVKELRHPFLLQTQAYWSLEDRLLIVMDLAEGSLRDRLRSCQAEGRRGIPAEELIRYMHEAAEALEFLHARDVMHRDVKPDNMLLSGGHIKLADFGLARLQASRSMATVTGSGTPAYMGPEVWQGKVSRHTDQYSLAAAYVELRIDRMLFPCTNLATLMLKHMKDPPELEELAEPERRVLFKALAKEPEQRYGNCREFAQELAAAVMPSAPPAAAPKAVRASKLAWIACLAIVSILGAVLAAWFYRSRISQPEVDWLPTNSAPEAGATIVSTPDRGKLYNRIVLQKEGAHAEFCVIPHEHDSDPPSFYIMRDKVSNALFQAASSDPTFQAYLRKADEELPGSVPGEWKSKGATNGQLALGVQGPDYPVMRVTVTEAYCFARWLGGNLPTPDEWDKASGEKNGRHSPHHGPNVAVNRRGLGPMRIGEATDDETDFGVRDMAGNGKEWTRSLDGGGSVPVANPDARTSVILRGRSYFDSSPLQFSPGVNAGYGAYRLPTPFIGFRVVLEK